MNNLPFDRLSFKFHNLEHEKLFENFTDQVRLTVFKIITGCLAFLGFIFIIQFLIQQQSYIINILITGNIVSMLFWYSVSKKIIKCLKYLNLMLYVAILAGSCYIALSGFEIPLYLYGFSCSCLSLPLIQYSHYKIKMSILILFPAIQLFVFNAYTLSNLGFIILSYLSQVLYAVQLYYNEYFLRLSFSFYQITLRQKEILEEYVSDPFLAISFDQRTQQFKPEFENKEFRKQFQDLDINYLKEFLRKIKIESNALTQSSEIYQRKNGPKSQTLEELCFFLINSDDQFKYSNLGKLQNSNSNIQLVNIEIKKIFLTQPILMILIKHEKIIEIQEQNEQKIKYYKNLINNFAIQITEQSEKLNKKYIKTAKHGLTNLFEESQCIHLLILNKVRNFWVLINNGIIKQQQFKVQTINFQHYLNYIQNYFDNLGKNYGISIKMHNFTYENLSLTNSIEMLSQILINLFELALKYSKKSRCITLEVSQIDNLNPKYDSQQNQISDIPQREKFSDQFLLNFKISFFSERNFELKPKKIASLNPKNLEDFQYNNEELLDIIWPVSCFALSRIGPYSEIETRKALFLTELEQDIFHYQMNFQIYSDYSQQDLSFVNYVKQQN